MFLNRAADPDGKAYWLSQINTNMDFMFADTLLFDGFADSAEFASKCASYGIIAGDHVDTSNVDVRPSEDPLYASSCPDFFDCLEDVNGDRDPNGGIYGVASSPEALDEFWTRHGWEIWYIDLGDGNTQKCYAHFGDSATLNRLVNVFREANGVAPLTIIDDPNDPRVQWSRLRAVEGCYDMSHTRPNGERFGSRSENLCTAAPDNDAFTWFRMEYYHARPCRRQDAYAHLLILTVSRFLRRATRRTPAEWEFVRLRVSGDCLYLRLLREESYYG